MSQTSDAGILETSVEQFEKFASKLLSEPFLEDINVGKSEETICEPHVSGHGEDERIKDGDEDMPTLLPMTSPPPILVIDSEDSDNEIPDLLSFDDDKKFGKKDENIINNTLPALPTLDQFENFASQLLRMPLAEFDKGNPSDAESNDDVGAESKTAGAKAPRQLIIKAEEVDIKAEFGMNEDDLASTHSDQELCRSSSKCRFASNKDRQMTKVEKLVKLLGKKPKIVAEKKPQRRLLNAKGNIRKDLIFKCRFCKFKTPDRNILSDHLPIHTATTKEKLYTCLQCSYRTFNKSQFIRHGTRLDRNGDCETCIYTCKSAYRYHFLNCPRKPKEYSCEHCSFKTKHLNYIKEHRIRHLDINQMLSHTYKCDLCHYFTIYKSNFDRHLKKHDKKQKKKYKCTMCDFETLYSENLNRHCLTKHLSRNEQFLFKCELCEFTTNAKNCLNYHYACHKEEKKLLTCNNCSFQTFHNRTLAEHYREFHKEIANDLFSFECTECSFKTFTSVLLKNHIKKRHSDGIIRKCNQCSFKTQSLANLIKHRKVHIPHGKLNFSCKFCLFKTHSKVILNGHLVGHKNVGQIFTCKFCSFQTMHGAGLQSHYLFQHSRASGKGKELFIKIVPLEHVAYLSLAAYSYERKIDKVTDKNLKTDVDVNFNKELFIKIVPLEHLIACLYKDESE